MAPADQSLHTVAAAREAHPRRFRLAALVAVALLAVPPVVAVGGLIGFHSFGGADFKAYYLAGLRVRAGVSPYDWVAFREAVGGVAAVEFLYPPAYALPFVPLSTLPVRVAQPLWVGLQLLVLWTGVLALCRSHGCSFSRAQTVLVVWAVTGFQAVVFVTRIGNVVGLLAGLLAFAGAAMLDERPRPYLAGCLTALAVLPKPYLAPTAAPLLADRRRLLGAAGTAVVVLGAGLLLFAPETNADYLAVLAEGKGWGGDRARFELPYHYRPFFRFPLVAPLFQGLLLVGAAATAWLHRRTASDAHLFALGCVVTPLVVPTATDLTLAVALPGLVVALVTEWRADGRPSLVLGSLLAVHLGVYSVRLFLRYGPAHLPVLDWKALGLTLFWVQPGTVGLLVVTGLLGWRIWQSSDSDGGTAQTP